MIAPTMIAPKFTLNKTRQRSLKARSYRITQLPNEQCAAQGDLFHLLSNNPLPKLTHSKLPPDDDKSTPLFNHTRKSVPPYPYLTYRYRYGTIVPTSNGWKEGMTMLLLTLIPLLNIRCRTHRAIQGGPFR